MNEDKIKEIQDKLLKWYWNNARILPWRDDASPYRVWVSEIMLQQTRVDTVKPYFERFIKAVPSIEALANLPDDQLLKLWEGLGYYSRAKNLKKAAGIIIEKYSGQMPKDAEGLQDLPGIGPYSSGAIASIAFGERVPAIDGNVLRVMARITGNKGDISSPKVKNEIREFVQDLVPAKAPGDFNQALMELGATICLPNGAPKCKECPVNFTCIAFQKDIALELPVKAKKKERKIEAKTVLIMEYMDKIALRQRPDEGLLSGLWEFPNIDGHLSRTACQLMIEDWGFSPSEIIPVKAAKHIFTHLEWHMIGYYISIQSIPESNWYTWATRKEIKERYSIPTAFKAYLKLI